MPSARFFWVLCLFNGFYHVRRLSGRHQYSTRLAPTGSSAIQCSGFHVLSDHFQCLIFRSKHSTPDHCNNVYSKLTTVIKQTSIFQYWKLIRVILLYVLGTLYNKCSNYGRLRRFYLGRRCSSLNFFILLSGAHRYRTDGFSAKFHSGRVIFVISFDCSRYILDWYQH